MRQFVLREISERRNNGSKLSSAAAELSDEEPPLVAANLCEPRTLR
jgi:hypothetical protein